MKKATTTPDSTKTPKAPKTRTRRTPEQVVADLEAKIAQVKERAAQRAVKAAPDGKAFVAARLAVSKALEAARESSNEPMRGALEEAFGALERHAEEAGEAAPAKKVKTRAA